MEWTALELRKASVLRKEGNCSSIFTIACDCDEMSVDLAIRLIQQAVENKKAIKKMEKIQMLADGVAMGEMKSKIFGL